jgi:hypothetical protein
MRTISKKKLAVSTAVAVVLVGTGTAAYAFWTSTGTGTGTGTTRADASTLSVTQDSTLTGMFPGDSAQNLVFTVHNEAGAASAKVFGATAYVTTDKGSDCDGTNFLVNNSPAASPVTLVWAASEIIGGQSATSGATDNKIQFNNKATVQDLCKGAIVTVHYATS